MLKKHCPISPEIAIGIRKDLFEMEAFDMKID
jgi:hypothetical protein